MGNAVWAATSQEQTAIDQERRATQQRQEQLERQNTEQDVRLSVPAPVKAARLPSQELPCFVIQTVTIQTEDSDQNGEWTWLLDELDGHQQLTTPDPVLGRCLGAQGIQIVIERLQSAVIARGYVTTRVLAAPQNLASGRLDLQALPGRVQSIRFEDGSGQRGSRWNTVPTSSGDVLNLRDVEQTLENYKRVPTVEADINIVPAAQPGYSDLVITHQQSLPLRLSLGVDNSGTRSTGGYVGNATLSYDNWWTLSDLFYITVQGDLGDKDPGPRGTRSYTAHYSVPFGYSLLSFTGSTNRYHQTVAGANANIVYSGTSDTLEAKLSRVIQRDNIGKTTASIKAFQRRSNNYIDDTEVEVQRRVVSGMEWGLGHRRTIGSAGKGSLEGNITYRVGTGAWGALPAPEQAFDEGTSRMRLWLLDITAQLPFSALNQSWTVSSALRGQYNKTRLTPQDRFSIGGRYTVRGFDGLNTLSAEQGWLWRNDISIDVAPQMQLYAGLDYGRVAGPSAGNLVGQSLLGQVLGVRGQYQHLQFDFFWGRPVSKPQFFKTSSTTFGFSLNASF